MKNSGASVMEFTFARLSATCVLGFRFTATVLTPGDPVCSLTESAGFGLRPWSGTCTLLSFEEPPSSTIFKSSISGALKLQKSLNTKSEFHFISNFILNCMAFVKWF